MPPAAVKKAAAGVAVPAAERADAPEAKHVESSGKEKAPKEGTEKKEKKEKKEVKDKAAGCAKLTAFFTMKPASAVPATLAAATPKEKEKVAGEGKTPAKRVDECILLDSDSEGAANIGSNTPPTATKKSDAAKKDCGNLANAMQVEKAGEGASKVAEASSSAGSASGDNDTSAVKAADGKAKAEAKKKAGRAAKTDNKDAKAKEEVAKGRQGTLCFQPVGEGSSRQTTLDIGGKTDGSSNKGAISSAPLKPKKERPPHPTGENIEHSSHFLTTLQFCNSFSEPLEIEAVSTEDFDNALTKFPDDVLSQMHMGLLYTVLMNSKETKDEVNFLDADTWPEILRQHLEDARGQEGAKARELSVVASDYATLSKEQRLEIFEVLVDDCLGTEIIKHFIDGSLEKLEELRREEQMDMLTDKYKKVEGESLAPNHSQAGEMMMAFVSVEEQLVEDLGEGKTSRQRALDRQREEEAREKRIAEEKRLREEKRLADEAARKQGRKSKTSAL